MFARRFKTEVLSTDLEARSHAENIVSWKLKGRKILGINERGGRELDQMDSISSTIKGMWRKKKNELFIF